MSIALRLLGAHLHHLLRSTWQQRQHSRTDGEVAEVWVPLTPASTYSRMRAQEAFRFCIKGMGVWQALQCRSRSEGLLLGSAPWLHALGCPSPLLKGLSNLSSSIPEAWTSWSGARTLATFQVSDSGLHQAPSEGAHEGRCQTVKRLGISFFPPPCQCSCQHP